MQRILAALLEQDEVRPGPGPGRRSSKFKGVSWAEASLKWRTQIWTGTKVGRRQCTILPLTWLEHAAEVSWLPCVRSTSCYSMAPPVPPCLRLTVSAGCARPRDGLCTFALCMLTHVSTLVFELCYCGD